MNRFSINKVQEEEESTVLNPYNENNKEMEQGIVESILKKYGIKSKIHNLNLYKRAFIHKSYVKRPQLENEQNRIQRLQETDTVTFNSYDRIHKRMLGL